MKEATKVFFDGGCRPNPGTMEAMVVIRGRALHLADLGQGSSEEAEWLALVHAAEQAASLGLRDIVLLGDAAGIVAQANGRARCRNFPHLRARFETEAAGFASWRLRHIARTQNLAGIALDRLRR